MTQYTVTVPMKANLIATQRLDNISLIVNDGWASFSGDSTSAEDFENMLKNAIEGLPDSFSAVEAW